MADADKSASPPKLQRRDSTSDEEDSAPLSMLRRKAPVAVMTESVPPQEAAREGAVATQSTHTPSKSRMHHLRETSLAGSVRSAPSNITRRDISTSDINLTPEQRQQYRHTSLTPAALQARQQQQLRPAGSGGGQGGQQQAQQQQPRPAGSSRAQGMPQQTGLTASDPRVLQALHAQQQHQQQLRRRAGLDPLVLQPDREQQQTAVHRAGHGTPQPEQRRVVRQTPDQGQLQARRQAQLQSQRQAQLQAQQQAQMQAQRQAQLQAQRQAQMQAQRQATRPAATETQRPARRTNPERRSRRGEAPETPEEIEAANELIEALIAIRTYAEENLSLSVEQLDAIMAFQLRRLEESIEREEDGRGLPSRELGYNSKLPSYWLWTRRDANMRVQCSTT